MRRDRGVGLRGAGRIAVWSVFVVLAAGCSSDGFAVRGALPVLEGGVQAMSRETDLELARSALPAHLKFVEGLITLDPEDSRLRAYAAQGLYGYAFGFVDDEDRVRASRLYERCLRHALAGLQLAGLGLDPVAVPVEELRVSVAGLDEQAVPNLFWGGACWAKWVDMNRSDPRRLADLGRAAVFMRRVLALDESYQYGGAHLFFGTYYAGRSPMLGGDYPQALAHFERARELSADQVFLVDLLQAQYLDRQLQDRQTFHRRLTRIMARTVDPDSDTALQNRISQEKAGRLLAKEILWF